MEQLTGETPPLFIIFGIFLVLLISGLLSKPKPTVEEDPDAALGKTVRKLFNILNTPKK